MDQCSHFNKNIQGLSETTPFIFGVLIITIFLIVSNKRVKFTILRDIQKEKFRIHKRICCFISAINIDNIGEEKANHSGHCEQIGPKSSSGFDGIQ